MLSSVPRPAFVSPDGELADLFIQGSYEAIMVEGGRFFNSTNDMIRVDILRKFLEITKDSRQTPTKSGRFRESTGRPRGKMLARHVSRYP